VKAGSAEPRAELGDVSWGNGRGLRERWRRTQVLQLPPQTWPKRPFRQLVDSGAAIVLISSNITIVTSVYVKRLAVVLIHRNSQETRERERGWSGTVPQYHTGITGYTYHRRNYTGKRHSTRVMPVEDPPALQAGPLPRTCQGTPHSKNHRPGVMWTRMGDKFRWYSAQIGTECKR
jgi:hypothetical protein